MYTVYRHYNRLTNKSYIGMTSLEPKKRWENGLSGYRNNQQMYNDIKNSDWNKDWEHNILGKFEDKQEALNVEEMFIRLFDSTNEGYNTSSYGSGNYERTEESRKKMSKSKIGKHFSEEHKNKISEAHKEKIYANIKPILQFSKNGELIAEYSSLTKASRQTGCSAPLICNCCKGKRKSCGGYIWEYK